MPVSMIHLSVAKKVNPNASIDFYVGNLAPDVNRGGLCRFEKATKSFGKNTWNKIERNRLRNLTTDTSLNMERKTLFPTITCRIILQATRITHNVL